MADPTKVTIPISAHSLILFSGGGEGRVVREYEGGKPTGQNRKGPNGADLWRLNGVSPSLAGKGVEGAVVETTTPLEKLDPGTIFAAEGAVEMTVTAQAKPGYGDSGPRGTLGVRIFVETLTPRGNIGALLADTASEILNDTPRRAKAGA
ncbi:MAG: hypothetical protein QM673_16185 [Gordonia sp. (in: high G+C Gram-positive bacteria)]